MAETSRGPYTGVARAARRLAEAGESHEETLRRELVEECGVTLGAVRSWHGFAFHVDRLRLGRPGGTVAP